MCKASYLPISRRDLQSITSYISDTLNAPNAASDFVDALDESVTLLEQFPYAYRIYQSTEVLEHEYRLFFVKNYAVLIFYVVDAERRSVEIHRVIYARRNLAQALMSNN